jgi:hypothetical protein
MIKYLRWRNWAVFEYNSITENIFLLFNLVLLMKTGGLFFGGDFFYFICSVQ